MAQPFGLDAGYLGIDPDLLVTGRHLRSDGIRNTLGRASLEGRIEADRLPARVSGCPAGVIERDWQACESEPRLARAARSVEADEEKKVVDSEPAIRQVSVFS